MTKLKVLIGFCDHISQHALPLFNASKYELIFCEPKINPPIEELEKKIADVDAIFWGPSQHLSEHLIQKAGSNLKVVSTMLAGYDNVDTRALRERRVKFGNTSLALANTVANTTMTLILATASRLQQGREHILNGTWTTEKFNWFMCHEIQGATFGIVGFGKIGEAIARRLGPFEIGKLLYCGHTVKPQAQALGGEFVPFDTLIEQSDYVIAACPLTDETKLLFNKDVFDKMKSSAIFINIGRGGLVDQPALVAALQSGGIAGAGLDVMTPEPLPKDDPLTRLSNCILLPHIGGATVNTRTEMAKMAARNIINALEGKEMISPVF